MNDDAAARTQFKAQLREQMLTIRLALPQAACRTRSAEISKRLLALPELQNPRCVLAYSPIRNEVDPTAAVEYWRTQGTGLAYPRIDPDSRRFSIHKLQTPDELSESFWNIPQPAANAPELNENEIDLVLIPALACDQRGHRLGYGHGYYDRLLARLTKARKVVLIYDFQLLPELPEQAHDVAATHIVSDLRSISV